jgi:hypothetical protein
MATAKKVEEKGQPAPRGYEDTFDMPVNDLERLSSQIKADLIQAEQDKQPWVQECTKDVNAYFGNKKQSDWPFKGAAKISSQMHRIMVDTTKSNLLASAGAPDDLIAASTNKSQSIENAKYVQDIHNALAKNQYKLTEVLDRAWHNALIESFVVLKPVQQYEVMETLQTIKRWLPAEYRAEDIKYDSATDTVIGADGQVIPSLDINSIPESKEELDMMGLHECNLEVTTEHVKEGTKILSISGAHIFLPISSPGETPFEKYQRAPYVIEDEFKTVQEMRLLQQQKKISNFTLMSGTLSEQLMTTELRELKEQQAGVFNLTEYDRHIVRNLWWSGKFEYKGKLRELYVYMNYETGTIMKVQVNNFGIRPYFPQVPFPVDDTPFGESEPKQIRQLVTELELAINTVINMGLIKAYPPKFFDPNGGFDPKTVGNLGPNSYIPVRDPSRNVFMPPQPEDPRILMEMIKLLMDLIERTTANSDTVQGQSAPTNTTKYEVQQKLVRAGVRFDTIYKRLKSQLEPMFEYIHKMQLRFLPLSQEVEMMGEQAVVPTENGGQMSRLQAIYIQEGAHGLSLKGNSVIEEETKLQKALQLAELAAKPPYSSYISFKPESPYYLLFNAIQHFNPVMMDKILAKPEEVAKLMRDRAQVQNEQEQQAVEEGKQQTNMQAQAQAQMAQMELQMKAQAAQLDAAKKQQDIQAEAERAHQEMRMKEQEHDQKMRQMAEAHALKMELLRKESNARANAPKPNK